MKVKNIFKFMSVLFILLTVILGYNYFLLYKANRCYYIGEYRNAQTFYNKVFIKEFITLDDLANKSICEMKVKEYDMAIQTLDELEVLDEKNTKRNLIYPNKGVAYYNLNDYKKVVFYLEEYFESEKDNDISKIYIPYLLDSYLNLSEYDICINRALDFKKSVRVSEVDLLKIIHNSIIDCNLRKENYNQALQITNELIELDTNDIESYLTKVVVLQYDHDLDYMHKYLEDLKEKFPNNKQLDKYLN